MTYSMKEALLKGSVLDDRWGRPVSRETPKYTVTLTAGEMEQCFSPDADQTWKALCSLMVSKGIPMEQLKRGIVSEAENADGSLTLELE